MANTYNLTYTSMTTFIEYLQYPFFTRALIIGGIMSLLLSWMSSYIVLRQEVLFTHALSNIGFLGIALAILFSLPITPMLIGTCLIAAALIRFIQNKKIFSNDSLLGIFSQIGLALGVIVIALFPGYRVNIEQYLFGDILGVTSFDMQLSLFLLIAIGTTIIAFHNNFLRISLSDTLSHSIVKNKRLYHGIFIIAVATLIAMSMKIIGVLLVAAFTTIPSNCGKLFAKSIKQTFIISTLIGILSTFIGFYISILLNLPSGPLVVCVLGIFWLIAMLYNQFKK